MSKNNDSTYKAMSYSLIVESTFHLPTEWDDDPCGHETRVIMNTTHQEDVKNMQEANPRGHSAAMISLAGSVFINSMDAIRISD